MATLQNIGKLKYRGKDGQWHPLPVVVQDADGGVSTISGKGAPTSATQGAINQLYRDEDTQKLYICTATDGGYTWAAVSGSGGTVDVDATLTKAGYAADAKAAGDAIEKKLDKTALPTAVNDALAQAKASGEFDGAKGDTGPAGPKGDTGPAGPKGADGKDGAGMDVTGAKVGQIAKITAVDSAGKPTGWEAVDMPSGGSEEWTKLYDATTTSDEATATLIVSKDQSGNSFAVKEIYVMFIGINLTNGENSAKAWISINPSRAGYNSGILGWITNAYMCYSTQQNYTSGVGIRMDTARYIQFDTQLKDIAKTGLPEYITGVEISAYEQKQWYGRCIVYGR